MILAKIAKVDSFNTLYLEKNLSALLVAYFLFNFEA